MTSQGVALGIKMSRMAIRKTFLLKCLCVLLLLFSLSSLKSITSTGFSDPENDVWHSLTNENIEMPWMDIINVYTYGSSIVIECIAPIPIEDAIPIDFLVLFSNDDDETNWEAAIQVISLGSYNVSAQWVIGNIEEINVYDWNLDPIGTHFSFFENVLTLFFTEFEDVSASALSVVVTAELEDGSLLQDWAPDQYQPPDFEAPELNDTTSTTTTLHDDSIPTDSTRDVTSTTTSLTEISLIPTLLSVLLMIYLHKRRKGL